MIAFFSHGHLHNLIGEQRYIVSGFEIGTDKILFSIWVILFVLVIFLLIKKFPKNANPYTKTLNIISLLLVTFSLVNILFYEVSTQRLFRSSSAESGQLKGPDKKAKKISYKPDIYYLIFDTYPRNDNLQELYNFDNSELTDYLINNDFYIATKSTTNYPRTFLSLASSLNMEYINYLTQEAGEDSSDATVAYPLLQDHKVSKFLKKHGYKYLHLGSWFEPTKKNKNADKNYIAGSIYLNLDGFSTKLLETTILPPIVRKVYPDIAFTDFNTQHRIRILYQFDRLSEIPSVEGPKFTFAHILIPHGPYVLDKNCKAISEQEVAKRRGLENYLNQLSCANKKIIQTVDSILSKSKKPPVIILQADEGSPTFKNEFPSNLGYKDASLPALKERFGILNAYYMPNLEKRGLYPSITPVNSFRLIFNQYLGADFEILPDKNYIFDDLYHLYKFSDITEKLKD